MGSVGSLWPSDLHSFVVSAEILPKSKESENILGASGADKTGGKTEVIPREVADICLADIPDISPFCSRETFSLGVNTFHDTFLPSWLPFVTSGG